MQWLRAHVWLLALATIASFAMLFRLDAQPIRDWDEGIHGEVSFEMIEGGDWLTPHYMGGTYFRKPPLKIWFSAFLFDAFGANAWTLRLPSAFAGIATSLLVAWWVWQWRKNRLDAFLAGLIVATMRPIFSHGFRTGEMDGVLTFFVTAALYYWWRASDYRRQPTNDRATRQWFVVCGAAIGLAVMTKSAAGLLSIPIIAAHALLTGTWRRIRVRDLLVLLLMLIAVTAPWHLAMTILHGTSFWEQYLGWHVIQRVATALHNENAGIWWYLPTFAQKFTPYVFWLVPALFFPLLSASRRREAARSGGLPAGREAREAGTVPAEGGRATERFERVRHAGAGERPRTGGHPTSAAAPDLTILFLLWILITLALFTIAKTKFDWYLLPLYPAAVMLLVPFVAAARDAVRDRTVAALHLAAAGGFLLALPNVLPDNTIGDRILERWYALFGHPLIFTAIALATLVGIIAAAHRRWGAAIASRTARILVLFLMLIPGLTVTARHLLAREPAHPATAIAAALRGTHGVLVTYGFDPKQHPAAYFIFRTQLSDDVRILDGQSDLRRTTSMLREQSPAYLLTRTETELPEELRATVTAPRQFDGFTAWDRR